MQFTASAELRAKIQRATDLMRHQNPTGDLAALQSAAMDALIAKLEKEARGATSRPQRTPRPAKHGYVTKAARRRAFARDGERCCFVSESGRRCTARGRLEVDHEEPRAVGGSGHVENIQILCQRHNLLRAEKSFGRAKIERHQKRRSETSASPRSKRKGGTTAGSTPDAETKQLAHGALVRLGFQKGPVMRCLAELDAQAPIDHRPLQDVIVAALRVLT